VEEEAAAAVAVQVRPPGRRGKEETGGAGPKTKGEDCEKRWSQPRRRAPSAGLAMRTGRETEEVGKGEGEARRQEVGGEEGVAAATVPATKKQQGAGQLQPQGPKNGWEIEEVADRAAGRGVEVPTRPEAGPGETAPRHPVAAQTTRMPCWTGTLAALDPGQTLRRPLPGAMTTLMRIGTWATGRHLRPSPPPSPSPSPPQPQPPPPPLSASPRRKKSSCPPCSAETRGPVQTWTWAMSPPRWTWVCFHP
jgi:hypothetical protein